MNDIDEQIASKSISRIHNYYCIRDYRLKIIIMKFGKTLHISDLKQDKQSKYIKYIPSFKKNANWNQIKKSKFIESVLLGMPLTHFTHFIFSYNKNGNLEIIDGLQRIQTLIDFCKNDFELAGLEILSKANGTKFLDLSQKYQNLINCMSFRVLLLKNTENPNKRDVILRMKKL